MRGRGEHTLTFGYGDFEVAIVWLGQECRQRRPDSTLQHQSAECLRTSELCHVFRFLMALPEAGVLSQYDKQQGRQSHSVTSGARGRKGPCLNAASRLGMELSWSRVSEPWAQSWSCNWAWRHIPVNPVP